MKDILRGLLVLSVLLLKVPTANGQGTSLPQVIQPSPQSAELIRRIEFPAATYTGIPGNEIVLFNLESKELKLPIALSYNFSGLRPAEKQGILGLGWSLNAGGRITRNINKYPDEQCYNLLIKDESEIIGSTDYTDSDDDFLYLKNAVEGSNDLAIDNFYYNIVGLSGQFIFKRNTDIEEFIKPVLLPYQGINIEPHYLSENNGSFDYFEITDCNGTLYRFGKSILTGTVATERYLSMSSPTAPFENGISSWLLTEIISSDRSDTIFFMYSDIETGSSGNTVEVSHRVFSRSYNKLLFDNCSSGSYSHSSNYASICTYGFTQKKLTRIKYKRGRIDFTYSQDDYPDCVLERIDIFNTETINAIQSFILTHSKYHNDPSRLNWHKLNKIDMKDSQNNTINSYEFNYLTGGFPEIDDMTTTETYAVDYWGYYNGASNQSTLPNLDVWGLDQNLSGPADRNPNFLYSRIGALQEITYPTGGKLTYDYESHLTNIIGGLRVKEQHLITGQDTITKSFEYSNAFYLLIRPELYTFKSMYLESFDYLCHAIFEKFTFTSDPCLNLEFEGKTAIYSEVTEYLSKQAETAGKTIYYYDLQTKNLNYSIETDVNDILGYPFVGGCCNAQQYYTGSLYYKTFKFGEALNTQTLFYDKNDRLVKGLNYYYSSQVYDTINGLNVTRQYNSNGLSWGDKNYHFAFSSYYLYQINQQLDSIITHNYFTSDGQERELKEKEYFTYNTKKMPILIGKTTSAGEVLFTKNKYPTDYSSFPYSNMVERNIVNPLIERRDSIYKNGVGQLLAIGRTDYNLWGQHGYKPEFIKESTFANPLQTKIRFDYDPYLLNVTSITRSDDMVQSFIWGYQNNYPIAKAENANYTEIAYTGFENSGEYGGWNYQSGTRTSAYSRTGKYSCFSANMQRVVPVNSIVSLWVKTGSGTPTISGNTPKIYSTSDGWTYYEWNVNPGTITVFCSNGYIDDLRLYPVGALMTTYTYDPLIGMTSMTDPNGIITRYEYDSFGRLKLVRDNDGKLTGKKYYHYYNDPSSDTPYLNTSPSSMSFGSGASSTSLGISSNSTWSITDNASWLSVNTTSGTGNATVTVSVTANTSAARNATITITYAGGLTKTVSVSQAAGSSSTLLVSPLTINFGSIAPPQTATVTSNTSWTVTKSASWITLSVTSGTGNGTVRIGATKLTSGTRSGTVTIKTTDNTVTRIVNVYQDSGLQQ